MNEKEKTKLLRDACLALDRCFERLGYGWDDIESLLSDDLFEWWQGGARSTCDNCHECDVDVAPMLLDSFWLQLADKHETLCLGCMFDRAIDRKVDLELSSLKPCPFNLLHWPHSWFNLFAEKETPPTLAFDEAWGEAWNKLHPVSISSPSPTSPPSSTPTPSPPPPSLTQEKINAENAHHRTF